SEQSPRLHVPQPLRHFLTRWKVDGFRRTYVAPSGRGRRLVARHCHGSLSPPSESDGGGPSCANAQRFFARIAAWVEWATLFVKDSMNRTRFLLITVGSGTALALACSAGGSGTSNNGLTDPNSSGGTGVSLGGTSSGTNSTGGNVNPSGGTIAVGATSGAGGT